jgi:hypothetical protein
MLLLKGYTGCFKKLLVRSPAAPHRKKEKKKADRKVPDRPVVVKGERLLKKKKTPLGIHNLFGTELAMTIYIVTLLAVPR